jgi:hypothetical protein
MNEFSNEWFRVPRKEEPRKDDNVLSLSLSKLFFEKQFPVAIANTASLDRIISFGELGNPGDSHMISSSTFTYFYYYDLRKITSCELSVPFVPF